MADLDYRKRAERRLLSLAPDLAKFRIPAPGNPLGLTASDFAAARKVAAANGLKVSSARPRRHDPFRIGFALDAPNQPRQLSIQNEFRKSEILPLRLAISIDGSIRRCGLQFAGVSCSSSHRLSRADREKLLGNPEMWRDDPESDIEYLLDIARGVVEDRLVLLRGVWFGEFGHGSGSAPLTSDHLIDLLQSVDDQLSPWHSIDQAAEAILHSWSGKLDEILVAARYDEVRPGY